MSDVGHSVAVVTGAAGGIGRALAERLIRDGARVVLADTESDALEAVRRRLERHGGEVIAVPTDVGDARSVERLAAVTLEHFGQVDLVCNNAGVARGGAIADLGPADWSWMFRVNVWGVIHGIRAFLSHLESNERGGHILNTASMAGLVAAPGLGPYCASKYAVVAISESLRAELELSGSRVAVSVLCPAPVRTGILDGADAVWRPSEALRRTLERAMPPAEVAAIAVEGVRDGRFWIFTHPERLHAVEARTAAMLHGRAVPAVPNDWA